MNEKDCIYDIQHMKTYYPVTKGLLKRVVNHVKAVDDVTLKVYRGETLGVVGESGCGKTTLGKTIMLLEKPTGGYVGFHDGETMKDITTLNKKEEFEFRSQVQMVFQDPYSSLNPLKTIREAFDEPMRVHGMGNPAERHAQMERLMEMVNLRTDFLKRYPHEFSGGQRQRIAIARALCVNPKVVVCDEPVSALDVSIQAQVLNLMKDIQAQMGLTYIFIAHDLSVVQYMSDRIAVMYLGKVVELADARELHRKPLHPYTEALFSAVPIPSLRKRANRIVLPGDVPSPINKPSGCALHDRCVHCTRRCCEETPELKDAGGGHYVACHLVEGV